MNENQNNTSSNILSPEPNTPPTPPVAPISSPSTEPQPPLQAQQDTSQVALGQAIPSVVQPQASPINNQGSSNNVLPGQQQVVSEAQPTVSYTQRPADQPNPQIVVSTHIEDSAASTNVKPKSGRKMSNKLIFGLIALVIVVVAAGGFFILHKSSGTNIATLQPVSISIPSSWKTINSGLGYTVKAPSSWSIGASASSDVDGQNAETVDIGLNGGVVYGNASNQNSGTISLSNQKLDSNSTSEAAFNKSVTTISASEKSLLKAFGANTNGLTVTASNIKINGIPWLEVKTGYPGQSSANLYYWDTNHAIALIATESSKQAASKALQTYLLPMAASVQLK